MNQSGGNRCGRLRWSRSPEGATASGRKWRQWWILNYEPSRWEAARQTAEGSPNGAARLCGRKVPSTKTVGTGAVDYDAIVAPTGRHGFAGAKCRQPSCMGGIPRSGKAKGWIWPRKKA